MVPNNAKTSRRLMVVTIVAMLLFPTIAWAGGDLEVRKTSESSASSCLSCHGTATPASQQPGSEKVPAVHKGNGIQVTVGLSKPANGTFYVAGEKPVVTVAMKDRFGVSLGRDSFATLNLYVYGPQETSKTVTAVKLLGASEDRSKTPHHYIDLLKDSRTQGDGNTVRYPLQPVSNEEAGTYTASVWAVRSGVPAVDQVFILTDFQVGTATIEKQIVAEEKCAACHKGAQNGQFYFHHVDPTERNPYGNPSIDTSPVRTCKSCHNNNGYAAYRPPANQDIRIPDSIVNRVHGVHMGEELENPDNNDPVNGIFKNYLGVAFPANVKNCSACHADDRWKTQPSRLACGTCHDNIWFGDQAAAPKTAEAHKGGSQADDAACVKCHTSDTDGPVSIQTTHVVSQPLNETVVELTPPKNGKFYVGGEKPVVTIVIKDDKGNPLDHTKVDTANFSTAGLFVYGPRGGTVPVLTNTAKYGTSKLRASVTNSVNAAGTPAAGWTFAAGDAFKLAVNGNPPVELSAPAGLQTPAQVRDWLVANLKDVTITATATRVTLKSNLQGSNSRIDIYNSSVSSTMGWKSAGTGVDPGALTDPYITVGRSSYPINDLRKLSDPLDYADPSVTRNAANITYQLDDVAGVKPGTYFVYVWIQPVAGKNPNVTRPAIGFLTFQIGTETKDKPVATNCTQCHGNNIWHLDEGPQHPEPFNPDYCLACHDYSRYQTGDGFQNRGGTSLNGWSGYGATPLARRIHGVHFGRYLEHPEMIYAGNPTAFNEVIFPQDVRNCVKCHDPSGAANWKTRPSRLACLACHDSDKADAHANLMTKISDPADVWSSSNTETCVVCHGEGREFSPDKVHKITDPYKPPYPREKE